MRAVFLWIYFANELVLYPQRSDRYIVKPPMNKFGIVSDSFLDPKSVFRCFACGLDTFTRSGQTQGIAFDFGKNSQIFVVASFLCRMPPFA